MSPLQCFVLNDFFPWPCKKYVNTLLISLVYYSHSSDIKSLPSMRCFNKCSCKKLFYNYIFLNFVYCFVNLYFSFFSNAVLKISSGIDDGIFNMRWELFAYLLLAWVVVYFVVWKGLHNSGKVNKQLSLRSRCWTTGTRQKNSLSWSSTFKVYGFSNFIYIYLVSSKLILLIIIIFLIIPFWTLIGPGISYQKLIN